jgi:sRNA-binding regulator protein Hfq
VLETLVHLILQFLEKRLHLVHTSQMILKMSVRAAVALDQSLMSGLPRKLRRSMIQMQWKNTSKNKNKTRLTILPRNPCLFNQMITVNHLTSMMMILIRCHAVKQMVFLHLIKTLLLQKNNKLLTTNLLKNTKTTFRSI